MEKTPVQPVPTVPLNSGTYCDNIHTIIGFSNSACSIIYTVSSNSKKKP